MAINRFKQALHLTVAAVEYYDVVGIGEVKHMDVSSNLAKNPVDYVIEEDKGESTSLSNVGANLKRH